MFSLTTLYGAAIINGLVQCLVLLFNRRGIKLANQLLAVLVLLLALSIWNLYVDNVSHGT